MRPDYHQYEEQPVSRTYQYRKVMKPMLERKRRARINRCLDELKELMVSALQSEGENVSKLEKADILELTVQHLHKLRREDSCQDGAGVATSDSSSCSSASGRTLGAGFTSCATEVSHYLASSAGGVDPESGVKLLQHLGTCIRRMETAHQPHSVTAVVERSVWRPW